MRAFNIAGPCFPDEHYMLPPERRLTAVLDLIALGRLDDTQWDAAVTDAAHEVRGWRRGHAPSP